MKQTPHIEDAYSFTDWINLSFSILAWNNYAILWIITIIIGGSEAAKYLWKLFGASVFGRKVIFKYLVIIEAMASVGSGLLVCYFIWPDDAGAHWSLAGIGFAILMQIAHKAAILVVRYKWPKFAAMMLGDPRMSRRTLIKGG